MADAFKHLHQSGKVRHFGVSNFTPAQFALLQSRLPFTLATNQVEISRCISRYCWMARSTNCNNCVFVRWRGPAYGGRLFNDDYFQPLRETAVVAEGVKRGLD